MSNRYLTRRTSDERLLNGEQSPWLTERNRQYNDVVASALFIYQTALAACSDATLVRHGAAGVLEDLLVGGAGPRLSIGIDIEQFPQRLYLTRVSKNPMHYADKPGIRSYAAVSAEREAVLLTSRTVRKLSKMGMDAPAIIPFRAIQKIKVADLSVCTMDYDNKMHSAKQVLESIGKELITIVADDTQPITQSYLLNR